MEISFAIDLHVFDRDMQRLGQTVANEIGIKAMRAGGEVMQEALREAAPERPDLPSGTALPVGELANDIQLSVIKDSNGTIVARIGPGKKSRHVAVWVEYGHEMSHRQSEKRLIGGKFQGKFVPAHPWIRPTFETTIDEAVAVAGYRMQEEIAKASAQLGFVA
jgi:hypothetical protein